MYKIKRFILKIIKIFQYLPILWQDEDYDFEYLLLLIKFKIQRIKKEIVRNNIIVKEEQDGICKSINNTIFHIDNYLNYAEVFEKHYKDKYLDFDFTYNIEDNKIVTINKNTNKELTKEEEDKYTTYIKSMYAYENQMSYGRSYDVGNARFLVEPVHEFLHQVVHIRGRRSHVMNSFMSHRTGYYLNISFSIASYSNRIGSASSVREKSAVPTK